MLRLKMNDTGAVEEIKFHSRFCQYWDWWSLTETWSTRMAFLEESASGNSVTINTIRSTKSLTKSLISVWILPSDLQKTCAVNVNSVQFNKICWFYELHSLWKKNLNLLSTLKLNEITKTPGTRFKINLTRANNYVYFQTSWQNIALLLMKTANGPFIKVKR